MEIEPGVDPHNNSQEKLEELSRKLADLRERNAKLVEQQRVTAEEAKALNDKIHHKIT